ncbi:preprotein translocase subunit SecG [candidate division WOR-3 bacterium]|nr:preprotein translocase subunit SecG [candidate division WOR-3 bacterium]
MIVFLTAMHFLIAILLIMIILVQQENASVTSMFGGMTESTFGGRGAAPIMIKITSVLAILFAITSLILASAASNVKANKKLDFQKTEQNIPVNNNEQQQNENLPFDNLEGK